MNPAQQEEYEERAAILEYCGGKSREMAEALARRMVLAAAPAPPEKPAPPPGKSGQQYSEFREFWQARNRKR